MKDKGDSMMTALLGRGAAVLITVLVMAAEPALAHHAMGGGTPSTFAQGLLSGLGHPIIGIDHLAFLVAVGVVVGIAGLNLMLPLVFVGLSAVGVLLHVKGVTIPAAEAVVASSVILVGALLAYGARIVPLTWGALFALAGLFHGYAYGEAVAGAEATPIGAYLLGLVIVQTVIVTAIAFAMQKTTSATAAIAPRLAGAAVAGIGLAVLAQQVLPSAG
jgi:urease accessory protein